jgi:CHAD domain-containing protein
MVSTDIQIKPIKPVVTRYLIRSRYLLGKSAVPDDKTVHDIRVLMKKARSLLKLTGSQADNIYCQRNIEDLKNVGKILRFWRDSTVYRKIMKEIKRSNPEIIKNLRSYSPLKHLLEKPANTGITSPDLMTSLTQIDEILNKAIYRIRFQRFDDNDTLAMAGELEQTYMRVVEIFLRSRNNPKPRLIHKFRKTVKDLRYQLYIFRELNPSAVNSLEKKLDILAINLGRFNDLVQVIKELEYKYNKKGNPSYLDDLVLKIRLKQDKHLSKVWASSGRLFVRGHKLADILGFNLPEISKPFPVKPF